MNPEIIREFVQSSWLTGFLPLTPIAIVIFLIQSTLFLVLVLIADRLLKNNVANVRKFLWFWAVMMIPMITILANLTPATRADQYLAAAFDLPYSEDWVLNNELALLPSNESVSVTEPTAEAGSAQFPAVSQIGSGYGMLGSIKYWNWLVFAYSLVALILLARIPIGWKQLVRLRRTSMDADGERGARVYKQIAGQIGYTGACQVRLTHELESPVSFGIRNPIILFPSKYYEQLSESELHTTLLHELSHIKNHDPLRILLIKVIESLFFFQPLVWLASSRMYYLSELVADDSVLEAGVGAGCYANSIVNLIELGAEPSHQYKLATGIFSSPRMLVSRMEHLLDDTCGHRTKLVGKSLFASSLVLIIALAVTVQFSPRSSALGNTANGGQMAIEKETVAELDLVPEENLNLAANTEQVKYFVSLDRTEVVLGETVTLTIGAEPGDYFYRQVTDLMRLLVDLDPDMKRISFDEIRTNNGTERPWSEVVIALLPKNEGILSIPSFTIGNQQTQPIEIEVTSATSQQLGQNSDDLYLEIEVNKETVFVNEQIELSIKLFYTINGIRNPEFTELLYPNSVIQSIDPPHQYEEEIDGVRYGVYEKRYVLIPPKSGPFVIPDIRFRGEVAEGGSSVREISAFIEGLTIDVKEPLAVGQ